jgi:hypothetical protein
VPRFCPRLTSVMKQKAAAFAAAFACGELESLTLIPVIVVTVVIGVMVMVVMVIGVVVIAVMVIGVMVICRSRYRRERAEQQA